MTRPIAGTTRARAVQLGAGALLLALVVLRAADGTWPLDWSRALAGNGMDATVLWQFRTPRIIVAALVGAALGLSGSVLQTMLRNPLASPDIIGFTTGAAAGAVASIVLTGSSALVVTGALAGGGATAALVLALAWSGGALVPIRLILVGVGVGLMLLAVIDLLLSLGSSLQAGEAVRWLTGSFAGTGWVEVRRLAVVMLVAAPVLVWLAFTLERLDLGDDVARALGLPVDSGRLALTVATIALAAVAISVAGPLPFVAFLAGPIARGASRREGACLGLSATVGATIALAADAASGVPVLGVLLPAGTFTALVGGPYLLWSVIRSPVA